MMDNGASWHSGMGGGGISFRARPVPHFALDLGLDALGGRDYQGNRRSEVPFSISALVYANPRNPVQFYMLGGIGWSSARVECDTTVCDGTSRPQTQPSGSYPVNQYGYFGGQLGMGLEFRLSPPVALNVDLVGFIRGRTDSSARSNPEFVDDYGRTTNTSGGGLFRAGITFYW